MVLEALVNPIKAEKKPWEAFLIGIVYASMGVIISLFLFKEFSSIVMITLTTMASMPLVYGTIKLEEKKDLNIRDERILIKEHGKVLLVFVLLFLGFVTAFSLWYIFLPAESAQTLFQSQINTIYQINNPTIGNFMKPTLSFATIFLNNLKVLVFCLFFAFFYGFGAIFILTLNASILATVIGSFIRSSATPYFIAPFVLFKYLLHGIPEISAYFLAGLSGGIISIAVIRHDMGSKKFKNILLDSLDMIIISIILLLVAALLEVFISPIIL